jgi:hypothetical protein
VVRHRRQLVKLSTAVKAGVRALLAEHNIRLAASDLDGGAVLLGRDQPTPLRVGPHGAPRPHQ